MNGVASMSEEWKESEDGVEEGWSREIDNAQDFMKLLDKVGKDPELTWFSVCVNGVSRSRDMNEGLDRAHVKRARKKEDDFVRKGMASNGLDIQSRAGTGLDLGSNVVDPVNRLIAFAAAGENARLNKLFIDGDAEKFVEEGADFKVYHVLLDEKIVTRCVNDWLKQKQQDG